MWEQNLDVLLSELCVVSHGEIDLLNLLSFAHPGLVNVSHAPLVLGLSRMFERLARSYLSLHPSLLDVTLISLHDALNQALHLWLFVLALSW